MFSIIFSLKVRDDLESIKNYISLDNKINAVKTIQSILNKIDLLEKFPYLGIEIDNNLRELLETNYKYKIVYKVYNKNIIILSVYKYKNTWKIQTN